jgi:hypothetical protein
MIFHAFQREDDDSVFTVVYNIAGAALPLGGVAEVSTSSPDGVRVTSPSAKGNLFRGIVAEAIADSGYGRVQVGGYCSYAKVLVANSSVAVTAGYPLVPSTDAGSLKIATATPGITEGFGFASALATVATGSTTVPVTSEIFLRAL